jgi:hypothetical protein
LLAHLSRFTFHASRLPAWVWALLGYVALALLQTWPLALHLGDRFPAVNPRDAWGHYWNIWWFRYALATGRNLFYADIWYPPQGVSLLLATPTPFNGALALLPNLLFGPLVAYNLVALAAVALAGQATFLLTRQLTGHAGAAFGAGVIVGASPYLLGHLTVGHLNVAMIFWLPLFAYGLLRAGEGSRAGLLLAALCLPLSALTEWHATLTIVLLGGVLIAWRGWAALRGASDWAAPLRMIAASLLGGLLTAPLALAVARAAARLGERAAIGAGAANDYSANLLTYLLPQDLHPLWGEAVFAWRRANIWDVPSEGRVSLGLVALTLAALGLWRGRARLPWLVAGLLGLALALGPALRLGPWEFPLPMPFDLFSAIPFANVSRTPARFSLLPLLAVAALAAWGLRWLASLRPRLAVVAVLLLVAELLTAPYRLTAPPDPTVADRLGAALADDPAATALDLPALPLEQAFLYNQVHHQRGIYSTGGSLWRDVERPFRGQTPGFAELTHGQPYHDMFTPEPDPLSVLTYYHVRYVLLYADELPPQQANALRANLRRLLRQDGPALVGPDGALEAWRVPPAPLPAPFLRAGTGWHPLEEWTGRGPSRWMTEQAELYLERPTAQAVTIAFTVHSFAAPRRLEVRADNALIGVYPLTPTPGEVRLTLPPASGSTRLTLRSLDGAITPAAASGARDDRLLSFGLSGVRVEPTTAAAFPGARS